VEGEVNRRLGVLSLLYNRRRTTPHSPGISALELEKRMGIPREYLEFTTWYLKCKQYITVADNSEFALTALGVDYVETQSAEVPILDKLLNSGPRCATSPGRHAPASKRGPHQVWLRAAEADSDPGAPKAQSRLPNCEATDQK